MYACMSEITSRQTGNVSAALPTYIHHTRETLTHDRPESGDHGRDDCALSTWRVNLYRNF